MWKMKHLLHKFRWWLGLKLLYQERSNVRDAMWKIMNCGIHNDMPKLSNPSIELNFEIGHNQSIKLNNGARTIYIALSSTQVIVSAMGKVPCDPSEDSDGWKYEDFGTHAFSLPHCPNQIRDLVEARNRK